MISIININKQNNYYEMNFIKLEAIIIMVGAICCTDHRPEGSCLRQIIIKYKCDIKLQCNWICPPTYLSEGQARN